MITFRDRYNAYISAKKKADIISYILALLVAGTILLIYIYLPTYRGSLLKFVIIEIVVLAIVVWIARKLKKLFSRKFLRCFFGRAMTKMRKHSGQ